ncbi:unnamed protein product [Urochloa humidicola]
MCRVLSSPARSTCYSPRGHPRSSPLLSASITGGRCWARPFVFSSRSLPWPCARRTRRRRPGRGGEVAAPRVSTNLATPNPTRRRGIAGPPTLAWGERAPTGGYSPGVASPHAGPSGAAAPSRGGSVAQGRGTPHTAYSGFVHPTIRASGSGALVAGSSLPMSEHCVLGYIAGMELWAPGAAARIELGQQHSGACTRHTDREQVYDSPAKIRLGLTMPKGYHGRARIFISFELHMLISIFPHGNSTMER